MNDQVPPILYKYCRPDILQPLQNYTLRITQFNQLNDPLECMPIVMPSGGQAAADAKWRKFAYLENRINGGTGTQGGRKFKEFLATRVHIRDHLRQQYRDGVEEEWNLNISRGIQDKMSSFAGMVCLSASPESMLMWSHYALDHAGYVIGIDPSVLAREGFGAVSAVSYSESRPRVSKDQKTDYFEFFTKSVDWRYESEWRVILPLVSPTARRRGSADKGVTAGRANYEGATISTPFCDDP